MGFHLSGINQVHYSVVSGGSLNYFYTGNTVLIPDTVEFTRMNTVDNLSTVNQTFNRNTKYFTTDIALTFTDFNEAEAYSLSGKRLVFKFKDNNDNWWCAGYDEQLTLQSLGNNLDESTNNVNVTLGCNSYQPIRRFGTIDITADPFTYNAILLESVTAATLTYEVYVGATYDFGPFDLTNNEATESATRDYVDETITFDVTRTVPDNIAAGIVTIYVMRNGIIVYSTTIDPGDPVAVSTPVTGNSPGDDFQIVIIEDWDGLLDLTFDQYSDFEVPGVSPYYKYTWPNTNNITALGNASGGTQDQWFSSFAFNVKKMTGYSPTGTTTTASGETTIIWYRNGVLEHTEYVASGATVDKTYTYTGVFVDDHLHVSVEELAEPTITYKFYLSENIAATPQYEVKVNATESVGPLTLAGDGAFASGITGFHTELVNFVVKKITNGGLAEGTVDVRHFRNGSTSQHNHYIAGELVSGSTNIFSTFGGGDVNLFEIYITETGTTTTTTTTTLAPYTVYSELAEAVAGSPNWEGDFAGYTQNLVGSMSIGPENRSSPSGSFSVAAAAKKISNGGIAQDAGTIDFVVNGSSVHNIVFSIGANVSNRTYTFTGVNPSDALEIIITEG